MPQVPDDAVQAAAEVMLRQYEGEFSAPRLTWRDFAGPAREILEAAAPLLAGHAPDLPTARRRGGCKLSVEEADRLAQERPPYPPKSSVPAEQCPGPTGWHRPQVEDWNRGNRESTCTWCGVAIGRNFCDPVWRAADDPDCE